MRWKIIGRPHTLYIYIFLAAQGSYAIVQKLSNKQSAKVICRFDRCHSKRKKSYMSIEKVIIHLRI